jgi:hypothetical protein
MSKIKGKQILDASINLGKLGDGSKYLPSDSTLGSEKLVTEITDDQEFVTKAYVDTQITNAEVVTGDGVRLDDQSRVALDIRAYTTDENVSIDTLGGMVLSGNSITHTVDTNGVDIHLELDGTSVELAASNATDTEFASVDVDYGYIDIVHQNASGSEQIKLQDGILLSTTGDNVITVEGAAVEYAVDYKDSYTDRSLVDKGYVNSYLNVPSDSAIERDTDGSINVRSPKSNQMDLSPNDVTDGIGDTGLTITSKPKGILFILLNGMMVLVGDADKNIGFFFSADEGVTAKSFSEIAANDKLFFNANAFGYGLSTDDRISIVTI